MLKPLPSCLCLRWQKPAAFRRLCVETSMAHWRSYELGPAAFRRLCVETKLWLWSCFGSRQPPSGGCVLKRMMSLLPNRLKSQPPSGGCVLKPPKRAETPQSGCQPPSGGCVLKPELLGVLASGCIPAAFRRLCVETMLDAGISKDDIPAAFRRLCVETRQLGRLFRSYKNPAAFRRLCVETKFEALGVEYINPSRLQAAVC